MHKITINSFINLYRKNISHLSQLKNELKEELNKFPNHKFEWEIIEDLEMIRKMINAMKEHENKNLELLQIKNEEEKTNGI